MRFLAVLILVSGCAASALPEAEPCDFAFSTPLASGTAACSVSRSAPIALELYAPGYGRASLVIDNASPQGYARLEGPGTTRQLAGEVYGLTSFIVEHEGVSCTTWGGHVVWDVASVPWKFDLVSTCTLDFRLNGSITSSAADPMRR